MEKEYATLNGEKVEVTEVGNLSARVRITASSLESHINNAVCNNAEVDPDELVQLGQFLIAHGTQLINEATELKK